MPSYALGNLAAAFAKLITYIIDEKNLLFFVKKIRQIHSAGFSGIYE
jgi:hypothetical protein